MAITAFLAGIASGSLIGTLIILAVFIGIGILIKSISLLLVLVMDLVDVTLTIAKDEPVSTAVPRWLPASDSPVQVPPPMPAQVMAPPESSAFDDSKTSFDIVLQSVGAKKLDVIRVVQKANGLPLKDAAQLVENAPCTVRAALSRADAVYLKRLLEDAGATVLVESD